MLLMNVSDLSILNVIVGEKYMVSEMNHNCPWLLRSQVIKKKYVQNDQYIFAVSEIIKLFTKISN